MTAVVPGICTPHWAHIRGVNDLQPTAPMPADLAPLADRLTIHEIAARYAVIYGESHLDGIQSLMTDSSVFSNAGRVEQLDRPDRGAAVAG